MTLVEEMGGRAVAEVFDSEEGEAARTRDLLLLSALEELAEKHFVVSDEEGARQFLEDMSSDSGSDLKARAQRLLDKRS